MLSPSVIALAIALTSFAVVNETRQAAANCGDSESKSIRAQTYLLESNLSEGLITTKLEAGGSYRLLVKGEYSYDRTGRKSDGRSLLVDGSKPPVTWAADHTYCIEVTGAGTPLILALPDSYHADNEGALEIVLFETAPTTDSR